MGIGIGFCPKTIQSYACLLFSRFIVLFMLVRPNQRQLHVGFLLKGIVGKGAETSGSLVHDLLLIKYEESYGGISFLVTLDKRNYLASSLLSSPKAMCTQLGTGGHSACYFLRSGHFAELYGLVHVTENAG